MTPAPPRKRLLIISHMPHHRRSDGVIVGWAPTVRELDRLATRFERVRHIACLHPEPAPASDLPYSATNIELVPVPPSGADGFLGKLDVLRTSPKYIATILRELPDADMVHVRAPAHIALIAMLLLSARKQPTPRWFKYAGNWKPDGLESPSYIIQRWWLARGWHRGTVTVNGSWPEQQPFVKTFFNPSLDDEDVARGQRAAAGKQLGTPLRLIYVGRIETEKGADRAVQVTAELQRRGIDATLTLIGDGPSRAAFEEMAASLGISERVSFLGWKPPSVINEHYAAAHISLLPTAASEGWPKVLSEAMAYGVVPLAGAVSSIPQYLSELGTGAALPPYDIGAYADAIAAYAADPARWESESRAAAEATQRFTFRHYLASVDQLIAEIVPGISP